MDDRANEPEVTEELEQQICSWCWEELAVTLDRNLPLCEDCAHEVRQLTLHSATLTEDLKRHLEPHIFTWLDKYSDKELELLESILYNLGEELNAGGLVLEILERYQRGKQNG